MNGLLPVAGNVNGINVTISTANTDTVIDAPAGARGVTLYFIKDGSLVEGRAFWSASNIALTGVNGSTPDYANWGPGERYMPITPGPVSNGYLHVATWDDDVTVRGSWM